MRFRDQLAYHDYAGAAVTDVERSRLAEDFGDNSVMLMKNLYMAFRVNTIDQVIETHPNDARYYVGYVGWRPGELKMEIDRGIWSVLSAAQDVVFRKDMEGLWEELLQRTKSIRAENLDPRLRGGDVRQAAAFATAFSNVIFEPR